MNYEQDLKKNTVTFLLLLCNVSVFLWHFFTGDPSDPAYMLEHGACFWPLVFSGEYYRLFTSLFLHFSAEHLLSNMLCLFACGRIVEDCFGHAAFSAIYLVSGLSGGLFSCFFHMQKNNAVICAGASGAVFGLTGALLLMALFHKTAGYGIDRKRVPLAVLLTVLLSAEKNVDTVSHAAGLLAGFLVAFLFMIITERKKYTTP